MARAVNEDDLALLDHHKNSDNVGHLYDTEERFAKMLLEVIPDFEYPDFSWMTVKQLRSHLAEQI